MAERWVGASIPQVDIDDKLDGRARYVADLPVEGALVGLVVRSAVPHGVIRSIDTRAARRVPGVRAVVTAADLPEVTFGPYVPDWEVLARRRVRYVGDEVAAVAADTLEAAEEAAALVGIDVEPLPPVYDALAALEPGAPVLWDERPDNVASRFDIARGDVDAAFAGAAHVFEAEYSSSRIYQGYIEPIGVLADWRDGRVTLHVPTHIPHKARLTYAAGLGIEADHVRVVVPPIGGSFGAKYEMTVPMIAAALSREAGRPVRIVFGREEDAASQHPRPPFRFRHRLAVGADGRFLGREVEVLGIAGGRTFWSPTVLATAVHRVDSLYDFQAMRGHGRLVYVNENPTTCMRGFGNAEALFGIEQLLDDVALDLGIDPIDLRLRNAVRPGERTIHGWLISSSELPATLRRADELSGFRRRRRRDRAGDEARTGVRTGIGLACGHHVSGYKTILADYDGSSAVLAIASKGRVSVLLGEPDIGQGLHTVMAQLVADTCGIAPTDVDVKRVDTALSPAAVGTLASRATTIGGMAVVRAAEAAKARLGGFLAGEWGCAPDEVAWDAGEARGPDGRSVGFADAATRWVDANCGLPLLAEGVYRPPTEVPDEEKWGNPSAAYPFCTHVAEVEVDTASGHVRVTRYWAVHDSGRIINPATARSQVVGAIAQGVGWATMEDVVLVDGTVRNANLLDYRMPAAGDMPEVVVEFVEGYEPNGPLGAKSLAEAAINPVTAAIANAVHDATGVRIHDLPLTPERVWRLLRGEAVAVELGS